MSKNLNIVMFNNNLNSSLKHDLDSERILVENAKKDSEAFGVLFDKYYNDVYKYILYRTANQTLAEDLTSNTFYKALDKLWTFKWRYVPFSAWLIRIASNEINGHFRKQKNRFITSLEENHLLENSKNEETSLEQIDIEISQNYLFKILHKELLKLKPIYQEVLVLRFFDEKDIKEIGAILGKPEGTIKSLIHRGLNNLKKFISPELYNEVRNG